MFILTKKNKNSSFLLLQKCWSYNPDHRPTFKYCLEILEELITHIDEDVPLVGTKFEEEPQYITVIPDGKIISCSIS